MLKTELLELARKFQRPKEYAVDLILRRNGHEVLRLPPYHCQFNAIELIWAGAKREYDNRVGDGLKNSEVQMVWECALNQINEEYWRKSVAHTDELIKNWWSREKILDVVVEPLIINLNNEDSDDDTDGDEVY